MWSAVVVLLWCSLTVGACGGQSDSRSPQPAPDRSRDILAITTPPDGSTTRLRRFDRDTLSPRPGGVDLGEYHDAWAFSPDRRTLAVGTFARTGVRLVDVAALRIIRDIPMPIAAVGVGWISPDRIAVLLQRGGILVIDAQTGEVRRRWPLSYRLPCDSQRQATTPHGVMFVIATRREGTVRLVRVSEAGLRVVELERVRAPSGGRTCGAAGFTVDPSGERALVVASRGPIAEVNVGSLAVTYRDSPRLRAVLGQRADCRGCTGRWTAVWPAARTVAIAGVDVMERRGAWPTETPAGAVLVDTSTWSVRLIDRAAGDVASTGDGTLLTFGGMRAGVRATALAGIRRWVTLRGSRVRSATVAGNRVYVLDDPPRVTRVLDANTGALIVSKSTALARFEVLTGRTGSGDAIPLVEG